MRCLRPGGRRRCQLLGGDTAAFCASLVDGLAQLESTLLRDEDDGAGGGGGGGAVSMRWCADAMRLVERMQRELLVMFKKADVPVGGAVSYGGGGGGGDGGCWFEHYMQETAALLDFCNAFKSAVSRLHRYCMIIDFAAQVGCAGAGVVPLAAENGGAGGWLQEEPGDDDAAIRDRLSDVRTAVSEAERLGRKIMSSSSSSGGAGDDDAGGMVVVMLVAKITMAVVSMFVLQALTSPIIPLAATDDGHCTLRRAAVVPVPELQPWRESLSVITDRFPGRPGVAEHERGGHGGEIHDAQHQDGRRRGG